jgi:hypothetical protein
MVFSLFLLFYSELCTILHTNNFLPFFQEGGILTKSDGGDRRTGYFGSISFKKYPIRNKPPRQNSTLSEFCHPSLKKGGENN